MKAKDIIYLRNIHKHVDFSDYVTNCSIPDDEILCKKYNPIIIEANMYVIDYTETAKKYLKRPNITSKTPKSTFLPVASDTTVVYDLSSLSITQVQEIIDRNNYLFTQITNQVKENELLDKINELC